MALSAAIVLAAGEGTRMRSNKPKVLHAFAGKTFLNRVMDSVAALNPDTLAVVVHFQAERVAEAARSYDEQVTIVNQDDIPGTGRAVQCAMAQLTEAGKVDGPVLIAASDMPLLDSETLHRLVEFHTASGNGATVLTTILDDPTGYGRIIRDREGNVLRIVEQKDANRSELAVQEVNTSVYVFEASVLTEAIAGLKSNNAQGEFYLTDALENGQMPTISRSRQRMYSFGKFSNASSDQVDFMAFLDATRQFAPNMASQLESTYRHCIYYCVGTDMFDYLTGMSLFLPGDTVSDFIDTFKTHYDCGENYPNYSQFVYGYATLLAGGDYNFTLQKPEQSVGAPATGLFSSMQNTAFVPGGSYVAPEDASNVPILSDVIAAAPTQVPATSTWGGFGSVVSGAITPDENEAEEEEESFLLDLESDYACYMTLTQDELANLSLVEGLLYLDASDEEDTILIELGAMQNAGIDWTTGDIVSGFDGTWPMLDDQIVVMYDQVRTQNMRRSIIPVMLNGTSGYLVMMFTSANPDGVIAGFTEGYDANGLAVRGLTQLKAGDELIPLYPMLYDDGSDSDEFAEDTFEGDPILVGDTLPVFEYISLEGADSTFYYCFQLTDIFGETDLSDFIEFEM